MNFFLILNSSSYILEKDKILKIEDITKINIDIESNQISNNKEIIKRTLSNHEYEIQSKNYTDSNNINFGSNSNSNRKNSDNFLNNLKPQINNNFKNGSENSIIDLTKPKNNTSSNLNINKIGKSKIFI